jgi:4-amino-4-deoxy-L-arabinose transferase-like glycosyltransferase
MSTVPLTAFNQRLSRPWSPIVVGLVTLLLAFGVFLLRAHLQVGLNAVPGPGDEAEYDLLAMELAAGHGFRYDYDNPAWRAPYEAANGNDTYRVVLGRHGAAATTYRPPLFPMAMAGLYKAFGRSFAAVRVFNCLAMAAAGGLAAMLVAGRLGTLPGLLCGVLFAVVEHRARYHAGLVLTESLAALLAIATAAALVRLLQTASLRWALLAGVVIGLAILNRPLVIFWLPLLVLLVLWGAPRKPIALSAAVTLAAVIVIAPWGVRNVRLLGEFKPLGTHGEQNLSAAYSDAAYANRGIWINLDDAGFFPRKIDGSRPGIDRELARARFSKQAALAWMKENLTKLPVLAAMRAWQLWKPTMHWDALILGLAAFGLVLWPATDERRVYAALLLTNTLAVAVTWSVGGRFLVPLLPAVHVIAACGAWVMLLAMTERRFAVREWLTLLSHSPLAREGGRQ